MIENVFELIPYTKNQRNDQFIFISRYQYNLHFSIFHKRKYFISIKWAKFLFSLLKQMICWYALLIIYAEKIASKYLISL